MKVSAMQVRALSAWTTSLDYRLIRSVESLHPARLEDGRRIRGLELVRGLVIARDGQFYDTTHAVAQHVAPMQVLEKYNLSQLQMLFTCAVDAVNHARRGGLVARATR